MVEKVFLKLAEQVQSGLEVCETYTPPANAEVTLTLFHGNAAFTPNSSVVVVFDYNGPTEQIIWSTKGTDVLKEHIELPTPDGNQAIALCLRNGETGPIVLSGSIELLVKT